MCLDCDHNNGLRLKPYTRDDFIVMIYRDDFEHPYIKFRRYQKAILAENTTTMDKKIKRLNEDIESSKRCMCLCHVPASE